MQNYYQNEFKFNDFLFKKNLPKTKDSAYIINLDEYKSIGTHWTVLCENGNNVTSFSSFGV